MVHILIDGYNLIRTSPDLLQFEAKSLEAGRLELLRQLACYKQIKGHAITVVFDASQTLNMQVLEESIQGIRVLYSEMAQSADTVLINLARELRDQVVMVSSDREILQASQRAGCSLMTSSEFKRQLDQARLYDRFSASSDGYQESKRPVLGKNATRKKGPAKRLPRAKRRAYQKLKNI